MNQTASFSVKQSHRLVNTEVEAEEASQPAGSYYYGDTTKKTPATRVKPIADSESQRTEGSNKGISIRTTGTAAEDYY